MENLPKLVSERLKTAPPKTHPDPDLLAAFAEHSLKGHERAQLLEHLATCGDCREIVSLAQPLREDIGAPVVQKSTWLGFPMLRWVTAAALVVIVGGAVLLREQHRFATAPAVSKIQSEPQAPAPSKSDAALYRADKDQVFDDRLAQGLAAKKEFKKSAEPRNEMLALSKSNVRRKQLVNEKKLGITGDSLLASGNAGRSSESRAEAAPSAPAPTGELDAETSQPAARVPSTSESVELTAAAPIITTNAAEGSKAKESLPKVDNSGLPPEAVHSLGARTEPTNQVIGGIVLQATPSFPRWTISPSGTLQRSVDSGKTWEDVVVDNQVFRAVATVGADVWAGGSAGLLYYSSDAGQQWTRIRPSAHGTSLTDDIATIEFTDHRHGELTTTAGKSWSTSDAGQTWKKH